MGKQKSLTDTLSAATMFWRVQELSRKSVGLGQWAFVSLSQYSQCLNQQVWGAGFSCVLTALHCIDFLA